MKIPTFMFLKYFLTELSSSVHPSVASMSASTSTMSARRGKRSFFAQWMEIVARCGTNMMLAHPPGCDPGSAAPFIRQEAVWASSRDFL